MSTNPAIHQLAASLAESATLNMTGVTARAVADLMEVEFQELFYKYPEMYRLVGGYAQHIIDARSGRTVQS